MIKNILILLVFITSCTNSSLKENKKHLHKIKTITKYETFFLPKELKEISGISFVDDKTIAAVEDEHGIVYFYTLKNKKIIRKLYFSKTGDYEDIVRVGADLWVVNSAGDLYHIKEFNQKKPEVEKYKTQLKKKNDIEGLTYNPAIGSLLLSVKEKSLVSGKNKKDIYCFNIKTKLLQQDPYLIIDLDKLEKEFEGDQLEEYSKDFLKAIGNKNLKEVLKPTALGIHPVSKDLYILSSINNVIVIYGEDKKFKSVLSFKGIEFSQPEGLSFNAKAELFISNEGTKSKGNIIKVNTIDEK